MNEECELTVTYYDATLEQIVAIPGPTKIRNEAK